MGTQHRYLSPQPKLLDIWSCHSSIPILDFTVQSPWFSQYSRQRKSCLAHQTQSLVPWGSVARNGDATIEHLHTSYPKVLVNQWSTSSQILQTRKMYPTKIHPLSPQILYNLSNLPVTHGLFRQLTLDALANLTAALMWPSSNCKHCCASIWAASKCLRRCGNFIMENGLQMVRVF